MVFGTVIVGQEKTVFGMHEIAFPDVAVEGENILDYFLAQEGRCYNWHTLEQTIQKTLLDKCMPFTIQEHINMMET